MTAGIFWFMSGIDKTVEDEEKDYWRAVSDWVRATRKRYKGFSRGELTQCFMRGPFAGWSEREVAELADKLAEKAKRFPLRGHDELVWEDADGGDEDGKEGAYCPVCQSCGEDGCCDVEKSLLHHGCKYAQYYARQAYYDTMIIDEFHQLVGGLGLGRDETGKEVSDPIGDLYDRAWKRVEEKYGKS